MTFNPRFWKKALGCKSERQCASAYRVFLLKVTKKVNDHDFNHVGALIPILQDLTAENRVPLQEYFLHVLAGYDPDDFDDADIIHVYFDELDEQIQNASSKQIIEYGQEYFKK